MCVCLEKQNTEELHDEKEEYYSIYLAERTEANILEQSTGRSAKCCLRSSFNLYTSGRNVSE